MSINSAVPLFDYYIESLALSEDLNKSHIKQNIAIKAGFMIIDLIHDFDQDKHWQKLSNLLGTPEETLKNTVKIAAGNRKKTVNSNTSTIRYRRATQRRKGCLLLFYKILT